MTKKTRNNSDEEDVERLVIESLVNILNCATWVADVQLDDDSREEIMAQCDLVAAAYGIEYRPVPPTLKITQKRGVRDSTDDDDAV